MPSAALFSRELKKWRLLAHKFSVAEGIACYQCVPSLLMLPRSQRISTTAFATAFQAGRLIRHPLLQLRILRRNDDKTELRAAFVVPKKLGKATLRNRVRRRVREQYRLHPGRIDGRLQGCDLIFVTTGAAIDAELQEINAALDQLLQRAARFVGGSSVGGS